MSDKIILTGIILGSLLVVPMIINWLGVDDSEVPTWLKAVIIIPGFTGLVMMFFGLIAKVWAY